MRGPIAGTNPEEWLGRGDPVSAFSSSVEQALRSLAIEVGGLRAERDGLRLELEGVRAQLEVAQERAEIAEVRASSGGLSGHAAANPPQPEVSVGWRVPDWARHIGIFLAGVLVVMVLAVTLGPKVLPYRAYFVRSGSMEPAIPTDALVVLTEVDGNELRPGDVVTFDRPDNPDTTVTHRVQQVVVEDDGRYVLTKGDANSATDPWRLRADEVDWRVAFQVPFVGGMFASLSGTVARLLLVVVPVGVVLALWLRDRRRGATAAS